MSLPLAMDDLQPDQRLTRSLTSAEPLAIAVSGGVDSMTLAYLAHRLAPEPPLMVHAVSPAVPAEATARIQAYSQRHGWQLQLIDAGEFGDQDYLRNPVNRCFFCKRNLYGTIAEVTDRPILAGTNLDDLGDYRPGLEAARLHAVRHPYVEAGIDKAGVRALAARHGLHDLAELPAAPCLASRLETGIPVTAARLGLVEEIERLLRQHHPGHTLRARLRATGLAIELDTRLVPETVAADLGPAIEAVAARHSEFRPVVFAPYRMGSAFIGRKEPAA